MHAELVTQERNGRNLIYRAQFDRMNAVLSYLTQTVGRRTLFVGYIPVSYPCVNFKGKGVFMKRFHVHIRVENLAQSMAFYERLFASSPTRVESDYARKWMLEDPR